MLTPRQQRVPAAGRETPGVARAARRAMVKRTSVYRWLADPAFAAVPAAAPDEFFRTRQAGSPMP